MEKEYKVDVVVAGAGGAGLAAAHAAAQNGLKVLVLEKLKRIGGNTRISSGFFAINTKEQNAAGLKLSTQEAIRQLQEHNHFLSNGALLKNIIEHAKETLEEIEKLGMEIKLNPTKNSTQFAHFGNDYQGGSYHMYMNKDYSYLQIQKSLEAMGVTFIFGVRMTELLQDSNGHVRGLKALNDAGESMTVHAKASIITTGGFGGDKRRVAKVMRTLNLRTLGVPNMGEGLSAMEAAGGVNIDGSALIHAAQMAQSTVTQETKGKQLAGFNDSPLTQLLLSPLLWVDPNGSRFTNEDVVYDTVQWSNAAYGVGSKYYYVMDTATLESYTKQPLLTISKSGPGASQAKGDFVSLAEQAVQQGIAFKGDSLEELAQNSGMDPIAFKATVAEYNKAIASQNDEIFSKSASSLKYDVKKGPFYAFIAQVVYLGTVGGVRVDKDLRVLDAYMKAIPGLYTGGANAGGYYAPRNYPAYEGLASGFSWTSGRLAGLAAANDIKKYN
ncbi:FAD-dependent oxidoreductase [Streptococcus mutans]|uniref:FAD-dependent oxidoreductase n=1 Tax=Streptococcus mutans TaxID=1309 RepID=UPI0002B51C3C|nr:FAD-dependent oxidoreductase [Streptococcus mutans]EMB63141.1 putative reductase [Streptococcus mutans 4SM1]MCB4994876.1 FAD-dependent oxidoreductase [Streptococcus mutans]MCB5035158.1 FAD-dependent oxidoreductase [Streptococcus mutans]MCY7115381.1 FAD-dependent oxidoreductase [Streptococcus mutans]NLQ47246.1 FAD-dependent oxidoreductase [Streptococcus mutans]